MVTQTAPAGGGPSGLAAGSAAPHPGRIDVEQRVLRKVAQEAAATLIGVERGDVSVDVGEYRGGLAVRLSSPLPIPDLNDTDTIRGTEPVLARVGSLQSDLQSRLTHLLGREITRVNVTVTGAVIPQRRRVA